VGLVGGNWRKHQQVSRRALLTKWRALSGFGIELRQIPYILGPVANLWMKKSSDLVGQGRYIYNRHGVGVC
jgi:hypothetical protein